MKINPQRKIKPEIKPLPNFPIPSSPPEILPKPEENEPYQPSPEITPVPSPEIKPIKESLQSNLFCSSVKKSKNN
jgi:hypothetical protein